MVSGGYGKCLLPARGGAPPLLEISPADISSLPRARGCAARRAPDRAADRVSSPCAGVYRARRHWTTDLKSLLLVRGVVPTFIYAYLYGAGSLPRARGCTDATLFDVDQGGFSSPCAGVYPGIGTRRTTTDDLLPARGGAPVSFALSPAVGPSPPRARGCLNTIIVVSCC